MAFSQKALVESFKPERKELVVTDKDQVVCVPAKQDVHMYNYLHHAVTKRLTHG